MAESIKKRLAATSNKSNDLELRKLLNAALVDITALRSQVSNLVNDVANVRVAANNCVADIGVIKSKYNNALNLLDLDAGVSATNYFSVHNVGALTAAGAALSSSAPAALTLTS